MMGPLALLWESPFYFITSYFYGGLNTGYEIVAMSSLINRLHEKYVVYVVRGVARTRDAVHRRKNAQNNSRGIEVGGTYPV